MPSNDLPDPGFQEIQSVESELAIDNQLQSLIREKLHLIAITSSKLMYECLGSSGGKATFLHMVESSYVHFRDDGNYEMPILRNSNEILNELPEKIPAEVRTEKAKFDWLEAEEYKKIVGFFKARTAVEGDSSIESLIAKIDQSLDYLLTEFVQREDFFIRGLTDRNFGLSEVSEFFGEKVNFIDHIIRKQTHLSSFCVLLHVLYAKTSGKDEVEIPGPGMAVEGALFPPQEVIVPLWGGYARDWYVPKVVET